MTQPMTNASADDQGRSDPLANLRLDGKTAIVTGSSRGIGAGVAILLGSRGANIVINYSSPKSEADANEIVRSINDNPTNARAVAIQANIVESSGQEALVNVALELSPTKNVDILVHNTGSGDPCALKDLTEDFYEKQMDLNLKTPIFLTQRALPHIPRGGRIIFISSIVARMGSPQFSVYGASKVGLEALARIWAAELGQSNGITVNCVNPGPVGTERYQALGQEAHDAVKPMIDSTPAAARIAEVRDIAPLVGFLASEESRWVTGSVLSANGGLLMH